MKQTRRRWRKVQWALQLTIFSFLMVTSLAHAALEQVAPLSGGVEYYEQYYPQQTTDIDPLRACYSYTAILSAGVGSDIHVVVLPLIDAGIYTGLMHYYACGVQMCAGTF